MVVVCLELKMRQVDPRIVVGLASYFTRDVIRVGATRSH